MNSDLVQRESVKAATILRTAMLSGTLLSLLSVAGFCFWQWGNYILLPGSYIIYTQFRSLQVRRVQSGFVQAQVQTIEELIQQANNADGQSFFVYTEAQEVELINVACLRPVEEVVPEAAPIPDSSE